MHRLLAALLAAMLAAMPAAAQTLKPKPLPPLNGIKAAPAAPSDGIREAPQGDAAGDSLLVPVPDNLTWEMVAKQDSLRYSLIRHGRGNILFAWGAVNSGDSARFREALDAAKPIDEIWLESPGGDLEEGLEIGRLIHARRLATHIRRGFRCVSACNFMFMGGVIRYIDSGGSFEVHMFSNGFARHLRDDLVRPPRNYRALMHKFPSMDTERLADFMSESYPDFVITQNKVKAALSVVKQQNPDGFDDDQEAQIAIVRQLVLDYNKGHPDAGIDETAIIQKVVIDEDVKRIQMDSAEVAAAIARYLTEMSLSLKFLTRFASIHNDQPTALTRQELREFNVINTD